MKTRTIGAEDDDTLHEEQIGVETDGEESVEGTARTSSEVETRGGGCLEGNGIRNDKEAAWGGEETSN